MGERWAEPGCDGFICLQSAFISTIWRASPGNLYNVFNFTTRWHSCAPKCFNLPAFFFLMHCSIGHSNGFYLFLRSLLFDSDIWAMNSICWGESEVVLKRHFSARLQSRKILNQKPFALKAACIWKDQLPQPCAMCSIRCVIQIQVG